MTTNKKPIVAVEKKRSPFVLVTVSEGYKVYVDMSKVQSIRPDVVGSTQLHFVDGTVLYVKGDCDTLVGVWASGLPVLSVVP